MGPYGRAKDTRGQDPNFTKRINFFTCIENVCGYFCFLRFFFSCIIIIIIVTSRK